MFAKTKECKILEVKNIFTVDYFPAVLAVIINWNGRDDLIECLCSIKKLNYPKDKLEILVVDNGSIDGSIKAVARSYPDISVILNNKNIGYVKAVNQGIKHGLNTNTDYIWIFNNDVTVKENTLWELIKIGEQDKNIGVIAPVIYSYDNPERIDNTGYDINLWLG